MRALPAFISALTLLGAASSASAAQVCAWMVETVHDDNMRHVELWLQSDSDLDVVYQIGGDGLAEDEGSKANSPSSGSYSLRAGEATSPWAFGATMLPPGRVDIRVDLHAPGASVFDPPGPVLASYAFKRDVPEGEATIPPTLAARQCVAVPARP